MSFLQPVHWYYLSITHCLIGFQRYGHCFDDLKTFEGIIKFAELYYQWSDNQTPHIQNDGRAFIYLIPFLTLQVGYRQLGNEFVR